MNYLNRFKKLGLLLLVAVSYTLVFSCNATNENHGEQISLERDASRKAYKQKCSPCHAISFQSVGPALAHVADNPDTLVKKYNVQEKCHVGVGKASKKELDLIIEYLKVNNAYPDSTLNSF